MAIGFFGKKLTKFFADINLSDNPLARGDKLSKKKESSVISVLYEQQKISLAKLIQEKILIPPTCNLDLLTLNSLLHGILGRGIFSFTLDSQLAYVPLSNLHPSQTQIISLLKSYDPSSEFLFQSRFHPDDTKSGAIQVYRKNSFCHYRYSYCPSQV